MASADVVPPSAITNNEDSPVERGENPPEIGEGVQDSTPSTPSPQLQPMESLGTLTLEEDESTMSNHEDQTTKKLTARQKRLELLLKLAKQPIPQLGRGAGSEIDLSTEQDKKSGMDKWFEKRFGPLSIHKPPSAPQICDLHDLVVKGEITGASARREIQERLMKSLRLKRRKEQEERWRVFREDNSIEDPAQNEDDEDILSDPESELSEKEEQGDEEEEEEHDLEEDQTKDKPKCVFIDDEAEDSDSDQESKQNDEENKKEHALEEDQTEKEFENSLETPLMKVNVKDAFNHTTGLNSLDLILPDRLSQWDKEKSPSFFGDVMESQNSNIGTQDVLALCSGNFGDAMIGGNIAMVDELDTDAGDVLALCSGKFTGSQMVKPLVFLPNEEEDDEIQQSKRRSKKIVISDDEDDDSDIEQDDSGTDADDESEDDEPKKVEDPYEEIYGKMDLDPLQKQEETTNNKDLVEEEANEESDDEEVEDGKKEEDDEVNSSDDELAMYRKLQQEAPFQGPEANNKKKARRSEFFDDEASLSGDDVGSDGEEEGEGPNEYEMEEGDQDDVDEQTIKEQLHRQWMKQQQDEEDRRLFYWKDQLLEGGELHTDTDRSFRVKIRNEREEGLGGEDRESEEEGVKEEEEEEDEETKKRRIDMIRWRIENELTDSSFLGGTEENSLLMGGISALKRITSSSSNIAEQSSNHSRESLLQRKTNLSLVVHNMTSISNNSNNKGLFVNKSDQDNGSLKRGQPSEPGQAKKTKSVFSSFI